MKFESREDLIENSDNFLRRLADFENKTSNSEYLKLCGLVRFIIKNIINVTEQEFEFINELFKDFFSIASNLGVITENLLKEQSEMVFTKLDLFRPQEIVCDEKSINFFDSGSGNFSEYSLTFDTNIISDEIKEYISDFLLEAEEFIEKIEEDLLKLEDGEDIEVLNRLFRAMHTLKGGAGTIQYEAIQVISHRSENILDKIRNNILTLTPDIVDLMFECLDVLKYCCNQLKISDVINVNIGNLISRLDNINENKQIQYLSNEVKNLPINTAVENDKKIKTNEKKSNNEPENGSSEKINTETQKKNSAGIPKKTDAMQNIKDASDSRPNSPQPVSEEKKILRVEAEKLDTLMNMAGELVITKIMIENGFQHLKQFYSELGEINAQYTETPDFDRIMAIINRFNKTYRGFGERITKIELANTTLGRLTSNIQQAILKTRLVPLSSVFNRYNRLVRDLSKTLNKDIDLIIEGAETEVDKVIVEVIGDPLVHLIRNSLDHGIELPEVRLAKNKPAKGIMKLKAYYEGEQVIIELKDDGQGIDVEKVKKKAVEKGMIAPVQAQEMSKQDAHKLIFKAGFSTADAVTNVSGRGVGMDVVQDVLTKLKGRIEVFSEINEGTTIKLRLPLTMAIINVLSVKVGSDIIAIPLSSIKETISLKLENIRYVSGKEVFNLRGEVVPIIRLGMVLNSPDYDENRENFFVVIVGLGAEEVGLIVDELVQQQEVVIKNLGTLFKKIKFISGATIMGDGGVCLILDIEQILSSDKMYESGKPLKIGKSKKIGINNFDKHPKPSVIERKKILVVDDSKPIRSMLKNYIEDAGYYADEAVSGEEALILLKKNRYSLVTVDVLMPGMNGYELSANIRTMKDYLRIPIIMISALNDKVDKIKGFNAGIDEYLTKPVDKNVFINLMTHLLK
ncbi:chemotaxis protein CheW [Candidatus Dependentiae bacterium]|nr:chemotaxis protein CheW [Candidatus Dependentiae bacterium]